MNQAIKLNDGEIAFYSHWLPTLAPGQYSLTVTPVLKDNGNLLAASATTETFYVAAPRTELNGTEAYSCYPAPGQIGSFHETLPHIVFERCTLPWERSIDGSDPTNPHAPWMALILLTDADFKDDPASEKQRVPPIDARTLGATLQPAEANVVGPKLELAEYESRNDPCRTLDLPAKVFKVVMPRKADLHYLAHVREVKTDHKETWSLLKDGRFSVVVCNRFPESEAKGGAGKDWGIVNSMFLVSLEGWHDYFDRPEALDDSKTCRLLVLGAWHFTCQGLGSFKSLMTDLDDKSLLGRSARAPNISGARDDEVRALGYVNAALDMGFAPLNHDLRNSDKTISWYRGPLVPASAPKSMPYPAISCADAALRYDPRSGLFDASYAAAWQLGQLLALQDQAFAQALLRFRTDYQRWIRRSNDAALGTLIPGSEPETTARLTGIRGTESAQTRPRDSYAKVLSDAGYLSSIAQASSGAAGPDGPPQIPATVQNWLGQALLLYGVPFNYLVPDGGMLPRESIRFFHLDPQWIDGLLQGACSVGRASRSDELADQLLRARFFEVSEQMAQRLRTVAKQAADDRREGRDKAPEALAPAHPTDDASTSPVLHWPLSGFLLRSAAVETWVGLEAKAAGVDGTGNEIKAMQVLRMDRLAPDTLLCIYNGKVTSIEVRQPPEALHFGATSNSEGGYSKSEIEVPMHGGRVLKVCELTRLLPKLDQGDKATSATFARAMIESSALVCFKASDK